MIRYYFRLFRRVAEISTANMLVYRANLIFFFIFESFFTIANLGGLALGMNLAGGTLGGWQVDEVLFVGTLYNVGHQFFVLFFMGGLFHTGYFVWTGRMDYVLLRPLNPLIGMHAANEFVISNVPNLFISVGLLIACVVRLVQRGVTFGPIQVVGLLIFFAAGIAVRYGIATLVVGPAFLAEKLAEGEDSYWSIQSLGKFPTGVFPRLMQQVLTFVLPITTMAAIPAEVFFGRQNLWAALMHLAIAVTFAWLGIKFYEFAARRYQSVNTGA